MEKQEVDTIDWQEPVTKENCGKKLRQIRGVTGLSRRDLAQVLGCSIATIARIESENENVRTKPTSDFMDKLRALSVIGHEQYSKMSKADKKKFLEYSNAGGGIGVGAGTAIASISAAGPISGLSAAGITSGLAAIGGGMLGGLAIVAALPVAGGALGFGVAKAIKKILEINNLLSEKVDKKFEESGGEPTDEWKLVPENFWQAVAEKAASDKCGECLREIRNETGWSIKDLGKYHRLGESVEVLRKIERGERPNKSFLNKLRSFCYEMQSSVDEDSEE